jgi:hypothetical protein
MHLSISGQQPLTVTAILDALDLFLYPERLIVTLRS